MLGILPKNAHDALFSAAVLRLGEIHWYLLKAANLMSSRTTIHRPVGDLGLSGSGFTAPEATPFGKEVGGDEIHWWIWKKETNVGDLQGRTERALGAAQSLKNASAKLKSHRPMSYDVLVESLKGFADTNRAEIETLHAYVRWLHARDVLAPSILYAYRVWGSTRRGDRWLALEAETLQAERPEMIRHLAETVLGLCTGGVRLYAYERAHMDISYEMADSVDPEDTAPGGVQVPLASVLEEAARSVYDECATYFAETRDSLRNVQLDITKFIEQRDLIHSEAFWRGFIWKAVRTKQSEAQAWDLKETLSVWHAPAGQGRENAALTFAGDVASLANARGGVLVVGVTDSPRRIVGIGTTREVEGRLKVARDVIATHVDYPRDLVTLRQVVLPDAGGVDRTCLVIVVADASEPAAVHGREGDFYPVRRETGTVKVSRREVAGAKAHRKSENHDFLRELVQFARPD